MPLLKIAQIYAVIGAAFLDLFSNIGRFTISKTSSPTGQNYGEGEVLLNGLVRSGRYSTKTMYKPFQGTAVS